MRARSVGVAIAVLVIAMSAHAEDKAAARAAYAEGTKYYDLNKFEEALKAFEKAYWNYEEPAFLFNIAQCYRQLDRKREAVKFYRSYLRKVPDAPNRGDVEKLIASLGGANDQERSAPATAERRSAPASSPGTVAQPPSLVVANAPALRPAQHGRALRVSGLVVAGVGAAALGVGAGFSALAKDANRQFLQPTDGVYSPSAEANRASYQTAELVTFCVGGAAIVAGTTMYLVGRRR